MPHFHSLVLDGNYAGPSHSPGEFAALAPPETHDVAVPARDRKRLERLALPPGKGDGETLVGRASLDASSRAERSEFLARWIAWADLLKRVFEVDALRCPDCDGRTRLLAAIMQPETARRIVACPGLPPRAPLLAAPIEIDPGNDRALEADPTGSDRVLAEAQADSGLAPGFEFDQASSARRFADEDV